MECELCGSKNGLVNAIIEGTMVKVCGKCSKHGKVIALPEKTGKHTIIKKTHKSVQPETVKLIVANYDKLIKNAREKLKIKQEELALKIREKESVIHKLESKSIEPNIDLAKKLEYFLSIKLIEERRLEPKLSKSSFKDKTLTIGDLLKMKDE